MRWLVLVLALFSASVSQAQTLTAAQKATFKADILGRAALTSMVQANNDQGIADWYNSTAQTGEFTAPLSCWKPTFSVQSLNSAVDWAAFAALSQVKQGAYMAMTQAGVIDLTDNQVRAGITAIFSAGSATETTVFSVDSTAAQSQPERGARSGTRFEVLFGNVRGTSRRCLFFDTRVEPVVIGDVLRN